MVKRVYTTMIVLLLGFHVFGENTKALEASAVKMYQEGKYQEAIEVYNKILGTGLEAAAVYYNMGNCYYKLGEVAKAILNYERALLLAPRDEDAAYNLKLAQKSTVDNIKVLPEFFLVRWYNTFVTSLTADQWAYLSVFLFICFLGLAVLFFHSTSMGVKKAGFTIGIVALLLSVFTIFLARKQYHRMTDRNEGIIMAASVVVRGAPDNSGTELFVIHEGLKVRVLESLGEWYNIRLADGNEGWILKTDLEKI